MPLPGTESPPSPVSHPTDVEKAGLEHHKSNTSDYSHDDEPSDEDFHSLRRVSDKIPWKAYTIGFVECVERLSYYGTTAV